jgi:hypothetical protein
LFAAPFTRRRTVYGFIDRQDLPMVLRVFDFASPDQSTPMRPTTTVPQQALYLMNSPFVIEQARRLAGRPDIVEAASPDDVIRALYGCVLSRAPSDAEMEALRAWLEVEDSLARDVTPIPADAVAEGDKQPQGLKPLERLAQALLMTSEFAWVD